MRKTLVLLLVVLAGCTVRTGAATSSSAWQEQADTTLGAALSSLGTARILVENEQEGRLSHAYAAVGLRDALQVLDTESAGFLAAQPPDGRRGDNRRVVRAVEQSMVVLNEAATGTAGVSELDRARASVKKLRDEIAP